MRRDTWVAVVVSVVAAVMTLIAALGLDPVREGPEPWQRSLVGLSLVLSCLMGVSLAFRPGWTRRWWPAPGHSGDRGDVSRDEGPDGTEGRRRLGHHPDCHRFEGHRVLLGGRPRCAGCLGLAVGAGVATALTLAELAKPGSVVGPGHGMAWLLGGLLLVAIGLAQDPSRAWYGPRLHLALNGAIVVGFFGVVMGTLEASGRAEQALFALAMSFIWMDARIRLSQEHHAALCATCPEGCNAYFL